MSDDYKLSRYSLIMAKFAWGFRDLESHPDTPDWQKPILNWFRAFFFARYWNSIDPYAYESIEETNNGD